MTDGPKKGTKRQKGRPDGCSDVERVLLQAMGGGRDDQGSGPPSRPPARTRARTAASAAVAPPVARGAIAGGRDDDYDKDPSHRPPTAAAAAAGMSGAKAGGQKANADRGNPGGGKKRRGRRAGPVGDAQPSSATRTATDRFAHMSTDIHHYRDVMLVHVERAESYHYDGDTARGFLNMLSLRGLEPGRQIFYATRMWNIMSMFENAGVRRLADVTRADCESAMAEVLTRGYTGETNLAYALCIKRIVNFAKTGRLGSKRDDPYVPEVSWITPTSYRDRTESASSVQRKDLLTAEEFQSIVSHTTNLRDRALLWVLYEGAFRPGELLNMRVGGMRFADRYVMASTTGKTGEKGIALVYSFRPLLDWMEMHPYRDDPGAPLWFSISCKTGGGNMTYRALSAMLRRAARAAGIQKRVWPYLFRHTQLTQLSKKLPDQLLRVYGNWHPGSKMASRYAHLSGEDAKNAILALHGISDDPVPGRQQQQQQQQEQTLPMSMQECPRCRASNEPDLKYCHGCGFILDDEMRSRITTSDVRQSNARDLQHVTRNAFDRVDRVFNSMFADPGAHRDHGRRRPVPRPGTANGRGGGGNNNNGNRGRHHDDDQDPDAAIPRGRPRGQRLAGDTARHGQVATAGSTQT